MSKLITLEEIESRRILNKRIVDWIVDRAKKEYAADISLILLYGSFINGTSNTKSDVDCYFIPKTERGYSMAVDFIIDGVGYDLFPMSWERVEKIADLQESLLPCVGDVEIMYCSSRDDFERFMSLKKKCIVIWRMMLIQRKLQKIN